MAKTTEPEESVLGRWKERAHQAFGRYLEALEQDLPADSSIAEIEQAMLKHYRAMMSETLQLLAQRQELPPPIR
ncbi:MAG: hypothetical protein OXH85_06420 [Truepera sp.]|nr:hypothetical protein [Truepera sp.]